MITERIGVGYLMRRVVWLLVAVAAVFGGAAPARAQSAGTMFDRTLQISASVVVTTIGQNESDGTSTLLAAVFWRGTPGWFTASDPRARSIGGSATGLPDGLPGPVTLFIRVGDLNLDMQIEPGTGLVRIQDQVLSLESGNVILVDEVDRAAGPRIVETIGVEPRFPGRFIDIDTMVRRHPALFPFLRCDQRFPDQPQHSPFEIVTWRQMADLTCARLREAH